MSILKGISATFFVSSLVVFSAGCETNVSKTPEVSQENCTTDKIKMIGDKKAREKFAGECSRISTIRKTESSKNLLEYTKPDSQ